MAGIGPKRPETIAESGLRRVTFNWAEVAVVVASVTAVAFAISYYKGLIPTEGVAYHAISITMAAILLPMIVLMIYMVNHLLRSRMALEGKVLWFLSFVAGTVVTTAVYFVIVFRPTASGNHGHE